MRSWSDSVGMACMQRKSHRSSRSAGLNGAEHFAAGQGQDDLSLLGRSVVRLWNLGVEGNAHRGQTEGSDVGRGTVSQREANRIVFIRANSSMEELVGGC